MKKLKYFFNFIIAYWPLKVLSFVIAILVYTFYHLHIVPNKDFFLPIQLLISEETIVINPYSHESLVSVRSNKATLDLMTSQDIQLYADFSEMIDKGNYLVPIKFTINPFFLDKNYRISLSPAYIRLDLDKKVQKPVIIYPQFTDNLNEDYYMTQYTLDPTHIVLDGAESKLKEITSINTQAINLANRQESFQERISLIYPNVNWIDNISITYVDITVDIKKIK